MNSTVKKLLSEYEAGRREFRNWDLSGCDLRGLCLRDVDLSYANLANAQLDGADLRWSKFRGTNLNNCNLANVNLRRSRLHYATLAGADLSGANLRAVDFTQANLAFTNMAHADIWGAVDPDGTNIRSFVLAGRPEIRNKTNRIQPPGFKTQVYEFPEFIEPLIAVFQVEILLIEVVGFIG